MGCVFSAGDEQQRVQIFPGAPLGQEWYHGRIDDGEADLRLRMVGHVDGAYLVYDCPVSPWSKPRGDYYLLVKYKEKRVKWRINRRGDQYVIGENVQGAETFNSVKKIIDHYSGIFGKSLPLADGRSVKLQGCVVLA